MKNFNLPLPKQNIPTKLIYNPIGSDFYKMFDTKTGNIIGEMIAYPTINQDIYIDRLLIYKEKRQGNGTKFLNFAKNMSKNFGFEGRMFVCAGTLPEDPFNPPHIFYRKYGFKPEYKNYSKIIDKHIKKNKQLNYRTTPEVMMYYNPKEIIKNKTTIFNKIKNIFKIL